MISQELIGSVRSHLLGVIGYRDRPLVQLLEIMPPLGVGPNLENLDRICGCGELSSDTVALVTEIGILKQGELLCQPTLSGGLTLRRVPIFGLA